jgi:anti-anti-sigma factor
MVNIPHRAPGRPTSAQVYLTDAVYLVTEIKLEGIVQTNVLINNERAVVKLTGRFDFSAHRDFRESCNTCLDAGQIREIEVNLGEVNYLDSSALGMLLMLKERADATGKRVLLSDCRSTVRQVLDIANFGQIFSIA